MSTQNYGLSDWDQKQGRAASQISDEERVPFLRLKDGNNILRIITLPYRYNMVRFKASPDEKGYGHRINCSWPLEDCPAVKAVGGKAKERYFVGVIDRSDNQVKIFDMSVLVYQQLQGIKDDIEYGSPDKFDINVRMNSKSPPAGFYTVLPRGKAPLSEADVALRNEKIESLEAQLTRLSTPPKAETVKKRLEEFGYTGGVVDASNESEALPAADDEDYSFGGQVPAQA